MAKRKKGKTVKMTSPESYIKQRARTLPIYECWINSEWEEDGIASIIVARKHTNGNFTVGSYLVDLKCLGVKDVHYSFNIYPSQYKELFEHREQTADLVQASYTLVHNIVYAGLEFAEDYGFKPHKDFSVARYVLEEDTEEIDFMEINCGHDGKPFYIRSPFDSDMKFNQVIAQLEKTAGPGNYGFVDEQPGEDWDEELVDEWDDDTDEEVLEDEDFSYEDIWDEPSGDPFDTELDFNEKDVQNSMTFQFQILIKGVSNPQVWRRVTIPSYYNFHHFHSIIQLSFGWDNSHLYQFSEKGYGSERVITSIQEDLDVGVEHQVNADNVLLSDVFNNEYQEYTYIYDFGDSWEHRIILEKIMPEVARMPRLIDGKGACPPEDCGGVWGYENLKKILENKSHPEYTENMQWLGMGMGESFDPDAFNVKVTQDILNDYFGR